MQHTHLLATASVIALGAVVSGCGSSKATTAATTAATGSKAPSSSVTSPVHTATGAPLSRTKLIAQGDAVCRSAQARIAVLTKHRKGSLASVLPHVAVQLTSEAESLSALVPPKSMARDWEQIFDDVHLFGEYVSSGLSSIVVNRGTVPQALNRKVAPLQHEIIAIATRDGFKWCSRGV